MEHVAVNKALDALCQLELDGAQLLRQLGITGRRGAGGCCPVARYLHRTTGRKWRVSSASACLWDSPGLGRGVPLPPKVSALVLDFDRGRLPELEEQPCT